MGQHPHENGGRHEGRIVTRWHVPSSGRALCEGISKKSDIRHHHKHIYEYEQDMKDAFDNAVDESEADKIAFASL